MSKARVTMKPKPGESAERFVKRFCKKVKKMRIVEQVRDGQYYEKPSDTIRKEKKRLRREAQKKQKKSN
jgi:ribosomal protein S21|tara:strand:- start:255 stop:461 length:207 start_codon:yes stop_codon:yes gene_type:complete